MPTDQHHTVDQCSGADFDPSWSPDGSVLHSHPCERQQADHTLDDLPCCDRLTSTEAGSTQASLPVSGWEHDRLHGEARQYYQVG